MVNDAVWSNLSKCTAIPTLEDLAIHAFATRMQDSTHFILKHKSTLKVLGISGIAWTDGDPSVLCRLYGESTNADQLEGFEKDNCFLLSDTEVKLAIPKHLLRPFSQHEVDENGFIWVHSPDIDIHYKGKDQARQVLEECAASM